MGEIYIAQSGTPFTLLLAADLAGNEMSAHAAQRSIFVPGPGCSGANATNPGNFTNYFKTQCFQISPPGVILKTTAGRNTLTGPRESNLDISLFKNNLVKKILEGFQVQLRVEAFNILNRSNMQPPNFFNLLDAPPWVSFKQHTPRQGRYNLALN